jgi:hypothetical protein
MYQPKFGLYDSITRTTHPVVVELAHRVLSTLLERNIKIYLPFENMTKAEVISTSNNPDHFQRTHSCVSQRSGKHDGTCYGCILRRLGAIVSGIKDVEYLKNPLVDNKANGDNLLALLMFSRDILLDYQNMPFYQIENIEAYNKIDLFRRFALDNFAAIHILRNRKTKITIEVMNIFKDVTSEIGLEILKERINQVRSRKFKIRKNPIYSLGKKVY